MYKNYQVYTVIYGLILNKDDCIEKMPKIVDDPVNSIVSDELYPLLVKHRDRNNRLVDQLKKQHLLIKLPTITQNLPTKQTRCY